MEISLYKEVYVQKLGRFIFILSFLQNLASQPMLGKSKSKSGEIFKSKSDYLKSSNQIQIKNIQIKSNLNVLDLGKVLKSGF